ncbi:MAG: hypothetical protein IPL65_12595 [Lewinellaceae bacterium]|nr:hypothetical protein [Lewinellaceae bacterium]
MKKRIITPLQGLLAGLLLLGAVSANAGITVTLSSTNTEYTAGQANTFTFNVGLVYTNLTWVDRYQFAFPAGVTVVSATPASGSAGCGSSWHSGNL